MDACTTTVSAVVSLLASGAGALLGTYLMKRGERQAIQETLNAIEGRIADLNESARIRWTRRAEVYAELWHRLIMAQEECRSFLSQGCITDTSSANSFRNNIDATYRFFISNALFLPPDIREHVSALVTGMQRAVQLTTLMIPPLHVPNEGPHAHEQRAEHYALKVSLGEKFKPETGDLAILLEAIDTELRKSLNMD